MTSQRDRTVPHEGQWQACGLCDRSVPYGPHRYEGSMNARYAIFVCNSCRDGNHDGWSPSYTQRLLVSLHQAGLPVPERNQKGLLPRD